MLVSSAFWLDRPRDLVVWIVLFPLVLAPAERRIGSARWIATFALGHVGSTLVTAAAVWLAIHRSSADPSLGHVQDVGASYGFFAVAGLLTFALDARARVVYTAALWAAVLGPVAVAASFVELGHGVAVVLGYTAAVVFGVRRGSGRRGSWPSTPSAATPARGSPSKPS